jgi:hypothetical protein
MTDLALSRGFSNCVNPFLNAGLVAGRVKSILWLYNFMNLTEIEDDQAVMTDALFRRSEMIMLDYGQDLFANNLWVAGMERGCLYDWDGSKYVSKSSAVSTPLFIHFSGQFFDCYSNLAAHWIQLNGKSDKFFDIEKQSRHLEWNYNYNYNVNKTEPETNFSWSICFELELSSFDLTFIRFESELLRAIQTIKTSIPFLEISVRNTHETSGCESTNFTEGLWAEGIGRNLEQDQPQNETNQNQTSTRFVSTLLSITMPTSDFSIVEKSLVQNIVDGSLAEDLKQKGIFISLIALKGIIGTTTPTTYPTYGSPSTLQSTSAPPTASHTASLTLQPTASKSPESTSAPTYESTTSQYLDINQRSRNNNDRKTMSNDGIIALSVILGVVAVISLVFCICLIMRKTVRKSSNDFNDQVAIEILPNHAISDHVAIEILPKDALNDQVAIEMLPKD